MDSEFILSRQQALRLPWNSIPSNMFLYMYIPSLFYFYFFLAFIWIPPVYIAFSECICNKSETVYIILSFFLFAVTEKEIRQW